MPNTMPKEIIPGAPFPMREQCATELEKLARSNPHQAAAARLAGDLEIALAVVTGRTTTVNHLWLEIPSLQPIAVSDTDVIYR